MDLNWISVVFWLAGTLIVMLGPILLIHELAHFIFAKLAGIRVEEFGLGLPPRLLGLWRGRGYLKIGSTRVEIPRGFELPSDLEVDAWVEGVTERRDDGTHILKDLTVLTSDVGDLTPKRERVNGGVAMRGQVTEREPGTLYSINMLPMGAFVRMTGEEDPSDPRSLAAQSKGWRVAVMAAGPVMNVIAAALLLIVAYTSGFPTAYHVRITHVEPGTAAEEAGLQPGDLVVEADGERINEGLAELRSIIRDAPEEMIELKIIRDGEQLSLTATPGLSEGHGFLGIRMAPWADKSEVEQYSLPRAVRASADDLFTIVRRTVQLPVMLIRGDVSSQEARPTSLVGITQLLTFTLQQSVEWRLAFPALQTTALISLALGVTNLLPLPALDGGRILFVIIEAIRGRRIPPEREAIVHFVGILILLGLSALIMLQDLFNPIIPWSLLK
jgi:regulator of sigma E protease